MIGKENVLETKLGSIPSVEHLILNHCNTHRLNFAVLSLIKDTICLLKINMLAYKNNCKNFNRIHIKY